MAIDYYYRVEPVKIRRGKWMTVEHWFEVDHHGATRHGYQYHHCGDDSDCSTVGSTAILTCRAAMERGLACHWHASEAEARDEADYQNEYRRKDDSYLTDAILANPPVASLSD